MIISVFARELIVYALIIMFIGALSYQVFLPEKGLSKKH